MAGPEIQTQPDETWRSSWREFPWWLVAIFAFLIVMAVLIAINPGPGLLIRVADAGDIKNMDDVIDEESLIAAVQADSPAHETALETIPEEHILTFAQVDEAVQALLDGDVDVVILSKAEAQDYARANEAALTAVLAFPNNFNEAFAFVVPGIRVTLYTTITAFAVALVLGLLAGLGRISRNTAVRNIAITYVEFIRGVPTLVLIFTVAFVIVPPVSDALGVDNRAVTANSRAIIALAVIYGAFLAEIFRAGIESIHKGQMEAARSLGMTYTQAMRYIILPQAIRNISPALGNDFIAMLKDSSLVSVLAVRDVTQLARLHAGSTFRFRESYLVLTFLYLTMTIMLSLLLRWYEQRIGKDRG